MTPQQLALWEPRFEDFITDGLRGADSGHDLGHIHRVVIAAKRIATSEGARSEIVVPAAWLHDCVNVPKNSSGRRLASTKAADRANTFLRDAGYPEGLLPSIRHAIEAHSFSAQIPPETIEAKVVQDADRLDALGAIGIARCLMVGTDLGLQLYSPQEPFPSTRQADDTTFIVDHFYLKVLTLADTMQTAAGRAEALKRAQFLQHYLEQLAVELGLPKEAAHR